MNNKVNSTNKQNSNLIWEFFKPTKGKIIFLFILILFTFFSFFFYSGNMGCDFQGCPPSAADYVFKSLFIAGNTLFKNILPDGVSLILEFVYLYSLSCLIHLVISKIKENARRKHKKFGYVGIFVLFFVMFSINTASGISSSISINVIETKKLDVTFIPIDNPNNFNRRRYKNE